MDADRDEDDGDSNGHASPLMGWLHNFADRARDVVSSRVEEVTQRAADVAREEVGRLEKQLHKAALRAGVVAGLLAAGVALLLVGGAGALGATLGRPWLGQVIVGGVALLAAVICLLTVRNRARKRAAEAAAERERQAAERADNPPDPAMTVVGALAAVAGLLMARRDN